MVNKETKKAGNETIIKVGSEFTSGSGVTVVVTDVTIGSIHLGRPTIHISYTYDDNGRRGQETVSFENFMNNLAA